MTKRWLLLFAVALWGCSRVLGIDEPVAKGLACEPNGAATCDGLRAMICSSERWEVQDQCSYLCRDGACINVEPRSCPPGTWCTDDNESCCETHWVSGGDFQLRHDATLHKDIAYPRSVSGFFLDRFEVTTLRFRQFVAEYPDSLPESGQGAPAQHPELGWQTDWETLTDHGQLAVPDSAEALEAALTACEDNTYALPDHTLPINCVNWYVAFAFCTWDGGRLPTEAEWHFAAANGGEQRSYPWSEPPRNELIAERHAWFQVDKPNWVGNKPDGRGAFFHDDLAGNLLEWVIDGYREPEPGACTDCVTDWGDSLVRILRGGSYGDPDVSLRNAAFASAESTVWRPINGIRCARDATTGMH